MHRSAITLLILFVGAPLQAATPASPFATDGAGRSAPVPRIDATRPVETLVWHRGLDEALAEAAMEFRSVIMLVTTRGCPHCHRLKESVLQNADVRALLRHFSLVEMDADVDPAVASAYGVRGVPALLFLASDGRERGRLEGFVPKDDFERVLRALLNEQQVEMISRTVTDLLDLLTGEELTAVQWGDALAAMQSSRIRTVARARLGREDPFPRMMLVNFLADARLAVRMAAIELLEEAAGDDFGYDPWAIPDPTDTNEALTRWRTWAQDEPDEGGATGYAAMTREQVDAYLRDLVSGHRQRSVRAMRMLARGGPGILESVRAFEEQHTDLAPGMRNLIREVRYTILLPETAYTDPGAVAHRLVFGQQDARLQTLRDLAPHALAVLPIIEDHLASDEPMVRETAIETLVTGAGRRALPILQAHAEREEHIDVLITLIRSLSRIRTRASVSAVLPFLEHEHEDVVISVLQGLQQSKDRIAEPDVVRALGDERWRVRAAALDVVTAMRLTAAAPELQRLLEDDDPFVRYKAVQSLASVRRGESAASLEALFLRDDTLKGAALEALCSIESNPPASFIDALEGKDLSVLMSVVEALQKCGRRGLAMAEHLARHENTDIACGALRVLGEHGLTDPRHRALLLAALRSDEPERVMAALESMNNASTFWAASSRNPFIQSRIILQTIEQEVELDEDLVDLMDSFLGAPVADPVPTAPAPAPAVDAVDDVLAAFMGELFEGGDTDAVSTAGRQELLDAVREQFEAGAGAARFQAAMILAKVRDPAPLRYFRDDLASFTVGQRTQIAQALNQWVSAEVIDILRALATDRAAQVRSAAVRSILSGATEGMWIDALFESALRDDSPLKASEVFEWRIRESLRNAASSRHFRKHAELLLSEPRADETWTVLGLVLMDGVWRRGDERIAEPFMDHENPYVRRAAARALSRNHPRGFVPWMDRTVGDGSEHVRMVLPHMYATQSTWVHLFDAVTSARDNLEPRTGVWQQLAVERREVLLQHVRALTHDVSPRVQVESWFALLSRHEPIDVGRFVHTSNSFGDLSEIGRRLGMYLRDNFRRLDEQYAPLLAYLDHSQLNQAQKDSILAHFERGRAPATTLRDDRLVVERTRGAIATEMDEVAPVPIETAEAELTTVRLVYFEEPGCPQCEEVNEYLEVLKEIFPELVVEKHEVFHVRGAGLNAEYAQHFEVPPEWRMVTPTVFAAGGYVIRDDMSFDRLTDLIVRSMGLPDEDWYIPPELDVEVVQVAAGNEEVEADRSPESAPVVGWVFLAGGVVLLVLGSVRILRRRRNGA